MCETKNKQSFTKWPACSNGQGGLGQYSTCSGLSLNSAVVIIRAPQCCSNCRRRIISLMIIMSFLFIFSIVCTALLLSSGYAWPIALAESGAAESEATSELTEISVQSQAEDRNSGSSSSSLGFKISLLPEPVKTAESVNLEHEGIPSKVFTTYDNSQKKLADISNPIPILDSISEHEKYGNNGDMFDGIARTIVNGYEAFSNLLNNIIQKPKDFARSFSKGITAQLDIIGGKIVGL